MGISSDGNMFAESCWGDVRCAEGIELDDILADGLFYFSASLGDGLRASGHRGRSNL